MKKNLRLFFTASLLVFASVVSANTVIVKGYVKDSANHAVANKVVRIYNADSTTAGCMIAHTVVTNPNGYYTDTLTCSGDIRKLQVIIENCNGQRIIREVNAVATPNVTEINFVICVAPGTGVLQCKAVMQYTFTSAGVKFTSNLSEAPAGDSIVARTWTFGDSTAPLTGNLKDPLHVYAKAGNYTACLTIKTKNGCESRYCTTIEYKTPAPCFAYVHVNVEPVSSRKFRFTSNNGTTASGDSIIKRLWNFGDGTTLGGNEVYTIKEFRDTGVYNICLTVKTVNGCEAQYCFKVVVRDTAAHNTACKAYFTAVYKDAAIYLSSEGSKAGEGDSIISRTWYYSGATVGPLNLGGNVADTFFRNLTPGTYNVYLVIKTKKGCESKFTATVTVPQPPNTCRLQATLTFEKISARKFRFSSANSYAAGDSIIKRRWKFGDGSEMDGNEISPLKEYKDTGVYNVCVIIKTKNGCEKQLCINVMVRDSVPKPANCKACFTAVHKEGTVYFNSACSSAPDGDSIVARSWIFGDSTAPVYNKTDPVHIYAKPGNYTAILYIKTKSGCESRFEAKLVVAIPVVPCKVYAQFAATRISGKKIQFNSMQTIAQAGDSIIQRKWKFGDGTGLEGNVTSPVKEYAQPGIYTACLQVKTARGCEAQECKQVAINDTSSVPQSNIDFVKIISINPNPVITRMLVTIWSRNIDAEVEIAVYDIYGTNKMSFKKVLGQGNNVIEVNVGNLYHGPYFLRISSKSGRDSRAFYKL